MCRQRMYFGTCGGWICAPHPKLATVEGWGPLIQIYLGTLPKPLTAAKNKTEQNSSAKGRGHSWRRFVTALYVAVRKAAWRRARADKKRQRCGPSLASACTAPPPAQEYQHPGSLVGPDSRPCHRAGHHLFHRRAKPRPRPVRLGHDSPRLLIFCWKLDKHMLVDRAQAALAQVDDHRRTQTCNLRPKARLPSTFSALRHRDFGPGAETAYRRNDDHGEHHLVPDPRSKATIGPSLVDVVAQSLCQK